MVIVCYFNVFLRIEMMESMEILFLECEGVEDYYGLCELDYWLRNVVLLLVVMVVRVFFVIILYGCKVLVGIFVLSMVIGVLFGRMVGIIV